MGVGKTNRRAKSPCVRRATMSPCPPDSTTSHPPGYSRPGGAKDLMAVDARLRPLGRGLPHGVTEWMREELDTDRTDVAELLAQVREHIDLRVHALKGKAVSGVEPWMRQLVENFSDRVEAADCNELLMKIAICRDRWLVSDSSDPLGPPPGRLRMGTRRESKNSLSGASTFADTLLQ